jgi:DNA-binding transcriptional MerR regulator
MKIKDVEIRVGITKANIRYYEKEGLISPGRNEENNYREYSEADVALLERIKVLRVLGVPISDIRLLNEGGITFREVLSHRLESLGDEERNLESVRRICEDLLRSNFPYNAVTEKVLEEDAGTWDRQLKRIIKEDITKEILNPKQFNTNVMILLVWGYLICAAVSMLWGNWLLDYSGLVPIFLGIVCYAAIYFTADLRILLVLFHITALNLVPETTVVFLAAPTLIASSRKQADATVTGVHLGLFWIMLIIYVLLLYLLARVWEGFFTKARYIVIMACIYTFIMTLLAGILAGLWLVTAIGFLVFTLFVGINWFHSFHRACQGRSRYYAVTEGCRMMNLLGVVVNMYGRMRPPLVFR